ncbi:SDR family NAD(P)-dependent oxidoreductase [Marinoscillum sp. MHG1-6]|uniref:SDR family NAD(P)-dependent oxidoreductase n=1 Tax=Marinoscillum sp. MHG1-6 TaxID=2959627 RepID=UPI0021586B8C|nr:SDR family NAD(P)-dependent oxidoreductase [Marinoscillum sp. MHG1-6]
MSKNIIITGTTGNLGSAVAKKFISEGYHVLGSSTPGRSTPDDGVDYFEADLTNPDSSKEFFKRAFKKYDTIIAGIFLVGGFGMSNIENTEDKDIHKMFNLNFLTAFHCTKNLYPHLKLYGGGKMVVVGAKPALEGGGAAMLPYTISKNAVMKLAELLNETGQDDYIQTSVIIPSIIDTPVNREAMPKANFSDWVTPESIAESIYFLISEKGNKLRDTVLKLYGNS